MKNLWMKEKEKRNKWLILCAVYLFLALADGFLTYWNTPDLKQEGNPLVAMMGFGWGALLLANSIGFVLTVVLTGCYCFFEYPKLEATSAFDFFMKLFYGEPYKKSWFWYKMVKKEYRKRIWPMVGCAYIYGMISARIVLVAEWLGITFGKSLRWYYRLRVGIPFGRVDIWVGMIICVISIFAWVFKGYRLSKEDQTVEDREREE